VPESKPQSQDEEDEGEKEDPTQHFTLLAAGDLEQ